MKWFVYKANLNSREIYKFNIFDHSGFLHDINALKKKKLSKEVFAEKLNADLMYYFWSKYEYETVVAPLCPRITDSELVRLNAYSDMCMSEYGRRPVSMDVNMIAEKKIDVYDQVMMNWDAFLDYVYGSKE